VVPPDPQRRGIELTESIGDVRQRELPHSRCLRDGDVVEHTERADDDSAQQETVKVDPFGQRPEEAALLGREAGQARALHEKVGQYADHEEAGQRSGHRAGRADVEAVRQIERHEHDGGRTDDRHRHGVVTLQNRR